MKASSKNKVSSGIGKSPDLASSVDSRSILFTSAIIIAWYCWIPTWFDGYVFSFFTRGLRPQLSNIGVFFKILSFASVRAIPVNLGCLIWAAAIFAAAFWVGSIALLPFDLDQESDGRIFNAIGLGLGIYSMSLLFLGLAGLWYPATLKLLVILPLAVGILRERRKLVSCLSRVGTWKPWGPISAWDLIAFALLACYLTMNVTAALGPEYYYDSLVYHLAMPRLYLLHHRIVPTPTLLYSGIPFGMEMLYGLALGIADERLAKLIQCGFGIVTAAAIFTWCRSRMGRPAAVLAALLYYCAPMVFIESGIAKVELATSFYLLLGTFAILSIREEQASIDSVGLMALAGTFAGLSFGTKYNAGLYLLAVPFAMIIDNKWEERSWKVLAKDCLVYFGFAGVVASPWLIKNTLFYGDPAYPFLNHFFHGNLSVNAAGLAADAGARDLVQAFTTITGLKDLLVGIWSPHWPLDNSFGIAAQILLPWIFLEKSKSGWNRMMTLMLSSLWLTWALHTRMPRFLLPALPLFSILAAEAVYSMEFHRLLRAPTLALVFSTLILSLGGAVFVWYSQGLWRVAFGLIDRDAYLTHAHPSYLTPAYSGEKFINENTPESSEILFIGDERGFYCERPFVTSSVFDVNPIISLANSSGGDSGALLKRLRAGGITHLLMNLASPHFETTLRALSGDGRAAFERLVSEDARLVFEDKHGEGSGDFSWIRVYSLK